ncbi:hypothetical protein ABIA38_006437 [Embleya sp. AB8]
MADTNYSTVAKVPKAFLPRTNAYAGMHLRMRATATRP